MYVAAFKKETLILPEVRILNDQERDRLRKFVEQRHNLVITGTDATQLGETANVTRFPRCPGNVYMSALEGDFGCSITHGRYFNSAGRGEAARLFRELRGVARRCESGADATNWRASPHREERQNEGILSVISGRCAGGEWRFRS
jgi:hypothetical protein